MIYIHGYRKNGDKYIAVRTAITFNTLFTFSKILIHLHKNEGFGEAALTM